VIDIGMVVVEFLIAVADACCREPFQQDPSALINVVLVTPATVEINGSEEQLHF